MVLAAQAGVVDPGSTGECVVLVRNTADEHDDFDVLVHGPAAVWATVDPTVVSVAPGDEVPVWIRFAVPRDAQVGPGPVDFAVTVASHAEPDFIHVESGQLQVGAFSRLRAALDPIDDEGRVVGVRLHLTNEGNANGAATVRLPGASVDERRVEVAPRSTAVVEFEVRRRKDLTQIVVEVAADAGEAFSLAASLPDEHRSLRRELTRSATILGGLLFAAFIAVALIGGEDDNAVGTSPLSVAPPTSTTAPGAPPVGAGSGETPAADDGAVPAIAANTGSSRPTAGAPSPAPDDLPLLAFVRIYAPGDRDVVVRSPGRNGAELRLRTAGAVESSPAVSPDGSVVAFVQERGGAWRACVVPVTGGEATCLFDVSATSSLAWRPDGSSLFAARGNELVEVTLDVSRSYVVATTTHPVSVPGGSFSLSPDGTRVLVVSRGELLVSPIDGSAGLTINVPGTPESPAWTPAGDRVVYVADTQLHVAPVGDGPIRQLTAPQTVNGDPVVAGDWVVFRSNRSGNGDLYAVRLDGADHETGGIAQITRTTERDIDPAR